MPITAAISLYYTVHRDGSPDDTHVQPSPSSSNQAVSANTSNPTDPGSSMRDSLPTGGQPTTDVTDDNMENDTEHSLKERTAQQIKTTPRGKQTYDHRKGPKEDIRQRIEGAFSTTEASTTPKWGDRMEEVDKQEKDSF
ncbi:hypothetical protein HAX54_045533 [Datura stramonium]|uniref:Uncharacterized protein n=1 Tax=Datura stramonium TaxID=4076 RepID=A0ABS8SQD8_DATST|nr:hypothetical protein [Datura stramonium]